MPHAGALPPARVAVVLPDGAAAVAGGASARIDDGRSRPGGGPDDAGWVVIVPAAEHGVGSAIVRAQELAGDDGAAVVVELTAGAFDPGHVAAVAGAGLGVGLLVDATGPPGTEEDRGASIGALVAALRAGAVTIRTADPQAARRVVAVVGMIEAHGHGARMAT